MDRDKGRLDFLKLVLQHQREIYAYILMLVPHIHDADDLFQNGMIIMWKKFDQFQPGTNFASWAIQVMRYEILDHRRRQSRNKRVLLEDALIEALMDNIPKRQDETAIRIEALRKCQQRLDDRSKRIIKMRYERNMPVEKIASVLNLSRRHVYHVFGQINRSLLKCMQRKLAEGGILHG